MEHSNNQWMDILRRRGSVWLLLLIVLCLILLSITVLYSVGRAESNGASVYARKQMQWLVPAGIAFFIALKINYEKLRALAWPIGILTVLALILVLIPGIGKVSNGARRWVDLGFLSIQVSDFAKLGYVFIMAHYLASIQRQSDSITKGFLIPVFMIALAFGLVLLEPDYGTAALLAATGGTMLFLSGCRMCYLVPTALCGISLFAVAIYNNPVRMKRILSFLDIEGNKADGSYQLYQGILGYGVGGIDGVGLGNGRQQMAFLPEAHTDFIFPIIGEELGFIFTGGVVLGFLAFFLLVVWRLRQAPDMFQFLLVVGALMLITIQALFNLGVVTGCLPTKGISLPFISYGGSNLVIMMTLVGLILNRLLSWERIPWSKQLEVKG
ncbi:MAG: cell division protein FtsW [Opitutales bacterium]|nr:cell division protein FtsW [Opitutales bacterium]